jgi:DNA-binding MarR family transcriptional regulator
MKEAIQLAHLEKTVFYALDKAIKSYRQFAQRNIKNAGVDITIDQWLLLKTINDHPEMTQKDMADAIFKDYASVTRMIELLVRKELLERSFHKADRRRYELRLTILGKRNINKLVPIVHTNRKQALDGFTSGEVDQLRCLLNNITSNCTTHE